MKNIIIITGASSGIGKEFALQIDSNFSNIDEIWLIARRTNELVTLSNRMKHKTKILPLDITKEENLSQFYTCLKEDKYVVRMLINSAGYGIFGDFIHLTREEQAGMIRLNCEALTNITNISIPYMKKNSRIIQISSSAAFVPQPGFAVYAATKAYVSSFSLALREELKEKGIWVTNVCPGPVDTAFYEIAEKTGTTLAIKKLAMVSSKEIVKRALFDSYHKKAKSIYSFYIYSFYFLSKIIPTRVIVPFIRILKVAEKNNYNE